jgi:hypothetical protein
MLWEPITGSSFEKAGLLAAFSPQSSKPHERGHRWAANLRGLLPGLAFSGSISRCLNEAAVPIVRNVPRHFAVLSRWQSAAGGCNCEDTGDHRCSGRVEYPICWGLSRWLCPSSVLIHEKTTARLAVLAVAETALEERREEQMITLGLPHWLMMGELHSLSSDLSDLL